MNLQLKHPQTIMHTTETPLQKSGNNNLNVPG